MVRLSIALAVILGLTQAAAARKPVLPKRPVARYRVGLASGVVVDDGKLHQIIGQAPTLFEVPSVIKRWTRGAVARIKSFYRRRGYKAVRVWTKIEEGRILFDVDEGKVKIVLLGGSTVKRLMMRIDITLPHNIFHEPTIKREFKAMRTQYKLAGIHYKIADTATERKNAFGDPVPVRAIIVSSSTVQSYGWRLGASLDSTWGLLPRIGWDKRGILAEKDYINMRLAIGIPFRKLALEENPRLGWVRGEFGLRYRTSPIIGSLRFETFLGFAASRYSRGDLALRSYMELRPVGTMDLAWWYKRARFSIGGEVEYVYLFNFRTLDNPPPDARMIDTSRDVNQIRGMGFLRFQFLPSPPSVRRGHRSFIDVHVKAGATDNGRYFIDARYAARWVKIGGNHQFRLESRGATLNGDIRFWNEFPITGTYQRAFFGNRYWVERLLQLTLAYRYALKDYWHIGIYHNGSLFEDEIPDPNKIGYANAFGPSVHFLIIDSLEADIFYGFGFSHEGLFSHNFSFGIRSAF